jgi:ferrous-iron efflux pump FieF
MSATDTILSIDGQRLKRIATYASIVVGVALIVVKLTAYFMTDSVAMLSSLLDSTIDLLASLLTAYSVASALKPPDHDHRFGHGKAEPLAALAQAAFIVGSSILLSYEALSRFYHPRDIENELAGYGAMVVAILLTLMLVGFQKLVLRRAKSMAIGADNIHYIGDLLINLAVIAAFALYQTTGLAWFDPLFAIVIAAGMAFSALRIAKHALNVLMDRELPDEDREKIKGLVLAEAHVKGLHDLRTRTDGERIFIEFHLELDPDMTLRAAHQVDVAVMTTLRQAYPHSDVLIHQDPDGLEEERLDAKIVRAEEKKANG